MPATFTWEEDHGALSGGRGTTTSSPVTEVNWKAIDDSTTVYTSASVTAGTNSFPKWQYGKFSGTFAGLNNGKFGHTAGAVASGMTLMGPPACTTSSGISYVTQVQSPALASLIDHSSVLGSINSGVAVRFGITGPQTASKAATVTGRVGTSPDYFTNFLTSQVLTGSGTPSGDTTMTVMLQYEEN